MLTDKELQELGEAVFKPEQLMIYDKKTHEVLVPLPQLIILQKAARLLHAIAPSINRMVEARSRAAKGKWWVDNGVTVEGESGNYGLSLKGWASNDLYFIVSAANETEAIRKVMDAGKA